jgi:hypothetical protein
LQTAAFPESRASIALHHSAGYATLAFRSASHSSTGVRRVTVLIDRGKSD